MPLARRVQTADGMFEFLGRLRSTEAEVRAAAEAELATLPEAIRGNVRTLASNARIVDPATMETTRYLDLWRAFQSGELTPTARAQLEGAIARIAPPEVTPPQGPARGPGGGGPRTTRPEIDSAGLTDAFGLREFLHDLTIPDGAPQPALLSRASARAALARMRLDPRTAPIADIIDNLIGNAERGIPGRDAFRTSMSRETPYEELDPFTRRALDNTAGQIEGIVRPQVMRAVMEGTTGQPLEQVGEAPQAILRTPPTEAGIGGRVPVRATGETGGPGAGGRGPGAGEPVPGQVRGAGGGGPGAGGRGPGAGGPRGGGPRGRAPAGETPAEAAPAEAAQPQVLQLQRGPRWYSRAGRRALGWAGRVRRGETAWQRRMRGETELETIGALQESTDQLVVRGLDNSVRTSPQSVVEIMRAVYERAMAPGTREAIRGELTGMLQSLYRHPEVQRALAEAARSGSPDAPVFARMLADVTRGIDAAAGIRPGMAAEAANTRRQNYLDTLPELTQLQRSLLVDSVEARGTGAGQPLFAETQRLLGIELNGQQRAAGLIGFERAQRVPPEAVLDEMGLARRNALDALTAAHRNALDALPQEMRGSPVLEAVRSGLDRRLRASQGGDVSAMLLEAIRSPEVATAVERAGGRGARQRFERAVREGDLNAVLDRISEAVPHETLAGVTERIPREISEPLLRFARAARDSAALTDELAAMGLMGERFRAVQEASLARGGAAAMAGRPLGVGTWMRGRLRSRGLRTFAHVVDPSWSLRTGIADFVSGVRAGGWRGGVRTVSGWRIAHAAGHTLFFLYGLSLPGGRRIIPPYYGLPELCDWFSNSGQLREGNRIANEILGLNVSEDNARWLTTREGMGFALSVVVSAPYLRPRDGADLRGMLFGDERGDIWIDPRRINDALDDARAMTAALGGLNTRYTTATTGEGDARSTARTELNERLTRLGITRDDVRAALIRERERTLRRSLNEQERAEVQGLEVADALRQFLQLRGRTEMDISDLRALRLEDWRRRGVVTDPRRAAVETYFRDARIDGTDLTEAVTFFTRPENREAFLFLWTAARAGNLPAAYVDDAVRYLMRTTTLGTATVTNLEALRRESDGALQPTVTRLRQFAAGLAPEFLDRVNALDATARTGATDRIKDDARRELTGMLLAELLRRRLVQEQFYLEIQQSDATTIGIRPNSFLYVLDRRAWTVSEFRSTFESMLSTYRQSPGALRAFNAFIVRDDKDIFGDPRALAQRISLAGGRGTDGTMRPVVAEVNGLLGQARSANAAVRRDAEQALRAALAPMGITLDSLNARLTDASRREALVEDFVNLIAESARAEGIIGPSILANAGDRSMYSADAPALARFAQRYPGTGGLLEWIRNNRENITNVREILRYIEQNEFMRAETRSATDVAAFAERNADVFRQNGWFNPTARTALQRGGAPGIPATAAPRPAPAAPGIPATAAPRSAPAAPGRQAAPRIRLEFTPQFPGLTAIEMTETPAPPAEPAQPPGAAPAPAVVTAELTQAQRQQAEAFYSSERGSTLGVTLNRLLLNMYRDVRARLSDQERDGDVLTRCFGPLTTAPDGTPVVPPEAIEAARMEIYRILISPRAPDAAMRRSWLPIDGAGDTLAVTIDIGRLIRDGTGRPADPAYARRVEDPLCFRIKQFTLEQLRAREGGQPPAGGR